MGGPTHEWVGPPIVTHGTNKGGEKCTRTHCQRGEPIGWGAIKTHCTAMDSVAANRRLNINRLEQSGICAQKRRPYMDAQIQARHDPKPKAEK